MRKRPQQERSQQMVTALIEATAYALSKYGFDGVTTPKIAEIAGVSVGSLYQYFDDKQALIEALLIQKAHELVHKIQSHITNVQSENLYDSIKKSLQYTFELLNASDGLYLEIVKNWNRLPMNSMINIVQSSSLDFGRLYLMKHYQIIPTNSLHVKFFIIINSSMYTMMRFISDGNALITQDELVDGLAQMIMDTIHNDGTKYQSKNVDEEKNQEK